MGNINWNLQQFPYSQYQWIPTQNPYTLMCPYDQTEANYQIIRSPSQNDIKCYTLRSEYQECLVAVLAILSEPVSTNIRCQKRNLYKILIEKIDYRLPDLGMISFMDGVYIIRQGIQAVKALSSNFNNFYFEDENIGINSRGNCKYWINTNFFNNSVQSIFEEEQDLSADHKLYEQNILGTFQKHDGKNQDDFCFMSNSANKNNPQQYSQRYRKARNTSKTLQNLYNKIYEKMQYQMTNQQVQLLNQCKNKFLSSSTSTSYINSNDFLQYQQNKTPTYIYSIQNMQKLINHLYKILNIKQNHCISIPQKEQKKHHKIKLSKGYSQSLQKCKRQISNIQLNYNSRQPSQKLNNSKKSNSNQSKSQIKRNYKNYKIITNTKTSLKKIRISDSKPQSINEVNSAKQQKVTGYPTSNSSFHHLQTTNSKHPSKTVHKQKITYIYEQQQNQKEAGLQQNKGEKPKIGQKNYYSNIFYNNIPELRKDNGFSQITLKSTANSFTSNFCISNGQLNMESRKISMNGENMIKMDSNRMFIQTQPTMQQPHIGTTNSNLFNQKANSKKIVFTTSSPVNVTFFNKPIDNLADSSRKSYFNERDSEQIPYSQSALTKLQYNNNDQHTSQKCYQNPPINSHQPSQIHKPKIRLTYGVDSYKSVMNAPSPIRKLRTAL